MRWGWYAAAHVNLRDAKLSACITPRRLVHTLYHFAYGTYFNGLSVAWFRELASCLTANTIEPLTTAVGTLHGLRHQSQHL